MSPRSPGRAHPGERRPACHRCTCAPQVGDHTVEVGRLVAWDVAHGAPAHIDTDRVAVVRVVRLPYEFGRHVPHQTAPVVATAGQLFEDVLATRFANDWLLAPRGQRRSLHPSRADNDPGPGQGGTRPRRRLGWGTLACRAPLQPVS